MNQMYCLFHGFLSNFVSRTKTREQKFFAQHIFSLEIVGADEGALVRERVAGACCGSKLPRVYRPLLSPTKFCGQKLYQQYKKYESAT